MTDSNKDKRTLTIKRTLNAPIQLVWDAWTNPEHVAKWWAPPGMETTIIEHDFKVGGLWKYSMMMPNGSEFLSEGIYILIEELSKIHSTADFKPMTEGVEIQAQFEDLNGKTEFTFNVVHATEEYAKQQFDMGFLNGWGSVFNGLETYLAAL